jgi:hypothetical protein
MSSRYDLTLVEKFMLPNAYGQKRTVLIKRNGFGRYTWRLVYHDNPALVRAEHTYTDNFFDDAKAAKRSARRFMKNLAQ